AVQMLGAQAGLECPFYLSRELAADVIEIDTLAQEITTQRYGAAQKPSSCIHQTRDLCRGEDGPAASHIEVAPHAQAFPPVRELYRLFEGRRIHHDGGAGEDASFKALNDPGIDARREAKIICVHDQKFCHRRNISARAFGQGGLCLVWREPKN